MQNALENVVLLKVDVTKNDQESHALLTYFDVIAPPTFLFFNPQGVEQKSKRHVGAVSPTQLLRDIELIN